MTAASRPQSAASGRSRSQSRSRSRTGDQSNGAARTEGGVDENDFCNAFWGEGLKDPDRGYEVMMARVKNAGRMVDEFRAFFKERAAIEEDYAKRMAKLARMPLGRDETGDLSNVLRRVQYEVDQSGRCHNELANVIRQTLEARVKEFEASRDARRRNTQIAIERSFKNKQSQEAMVQKAMEKYKSDCILINSFSARLSLTQGKDLDKVTAKLDKAQQTVQVNEAEYKQYCRALKETHTKWVGDWKGWCDLVQDLEEERIDFTRNALWSYVNAVSLMCVKDDESCENVRQVVELCDVQREIVNFVHREGGANLITDSPHFIDFSDGDKGVAPPASQPAAFTRNSAKVEHAPFDGLERLTAALYPQRKGAGTPSAGAAPSAPNSASYLDKSIESQQAAAQAQPQSRSHTPSGNRPRPPSMDNTPQQSTGSAAQPQTSPTKKAASATEAFEAAINRGRSANEAGAGSNTSQPPAPPSFGQQNGSSNTGTFGRSSSRPPSRGATSEDLARQEAEDRAVRGGADGAGVVPNLEREASGKKQLSAAAFRTSGSHAPAPGSPGYPYSSATSPRHASTQGTLMTAASPSGNILSQSQSANVAASPQVPAQAGGPSAGAPSKSAEDPLLAALAKLRSPSSAVDVVPSHSPGAGTGPLHQPRGGVGAVPMPGMAQQNQRPAARSSSVAGQGQPAQGGYQQQQADIPRRNTLGDINGPSGAQQGPLYGGAPPAGYGGRQPSASPAPSSQYTQARSRPASPNPTVPQHRFSQGARSRPASPNPQAMQQQGGSSPAAAMMRPPSRSGGPDAGQQAYGQAFPGERRASISNMAVPPHSQPGGGTQSRPTSPQPGQSLRSPGVPPAGYAGVGTRSASPQPGQIMSPQQQALAQGIRSPSPAPGSHAGFPGGPPPQQGGYNPQQAQAQYGQQRPASAYQAPPGARPGTGQGHRPSQPFSHSPGQPNGNSPAPAGVKQPSGRPTTPLGIALDAQGGVAQDSMAERYAAQQRGNGPQGMASPPPASPAQQPGYRQNASMYGRPAQQQQPSRMSMSVSPAPYQQQQMPMQAAGSPAMYPVQPQQQPPYTQQQQPHQPGMSGSYSQHQFGQQQQRPMSGIGQQPPPQGRTPSMGYQPGHMHQQPHAQGIPASQSMPHQHGQHPSYRGDAYSPAPARQQQPPMHSQQGSGGRGMPPQRQQSSNAGPPPTSQYTDAGLPILFYVKAIYKYDSQSPEEFSFQKDDIICVTETDEDGWWKGELMDPDRRYLQGGGNVFPSNFVTLLE